MAWRAEPGLHFHLHFTHHLHSRPGAPLPDTTWRDNPVVLGKVLVSRVGKDSLDPPLYTCRQLINVSEPLFPHLHSKDSRIYLAELSGDSVA